jgi:hypothetical protein
MQKHHPSDRQTVLSICDCGGLHLTYGTLTLHFTRDEFIDFAGSVAQLASQLGEVEERSLVLSLSSHKNSACH